MQKLSVFSYPNTLELSSSLFPFNLTDVFETSVLEKKISHRYGKLLSLTQVVKKYIKIELFLCKKEVSLNEAKKGIDYKQTRC